MEQWSHRATWLLDGFNPDAKTLKQNFKDLLALCNGDSAKYPIIHWCKGPGCCDSDDACLQKVIDLCIPLWCRGYSVPLLYRFKHYATASSYIRTACTFFGLLPRVMSQIQKNMDNKTDASSKLSSAVDSMLQEHQHGHFLGMGMGDQARDLQSILDDLLENDLSYSLQNSIRKRKVMEEICKESFVQSAIMIDSLISSLEYGSNLMFRRTSILTKMSALGGQHENYPQYAKESLKYFIQIISGSLGKSLMESCVGQLLFGLGKISVMGFHPSRARLDLFFKLVLACASDLWRRMVFEYEGFPYKWFSLLEPGATLTDFTKLWDDVTTAMHPNCCCTDTEFTEGIMRFLKAGSDNPSQDSSVFDEAREVLQHIGECSPLTADSVEVKHGQMQWSVSKRGAQFVKKGVAGIETAFLQGVIRHHEVTRQDVSQLTMPAPRVSAAVERQCGTTTNNQHTAGASSGGGLLEAKSQKYMVGLGCF